MSDYTPPPGDAIHAIFEYSNYTPPDGDAIHAVFQTSNNTLQTIAGSIATGYSYDALKGTLATSFLQRKENQIGGEKALAVFISALADHSFFSVLNSFGDQTYQGIVSVISEAILKSFYTQIYGSDCFQANKNLLVEQYLSTIINGLGRSVCKSLYSTISDSNIISQEIKNIIHKGDPSQTIQVALVNLSLEMMLFASLVNIISDKNDSLQNFWTELKEGDPTQTGQAVSVSLLNNQSVLSSKANVISTWFSMLQSTLTELSLSNPQNTLFSHMTKLVDELSLIVTRSVKLSDKNDTTGAFITELKEGNPTQTGMVVSTPLLNDNQAHVSTINALSDSNIFYQVLKIILGKGDSSGTIQEIKNILLNNQSNWQSLLNKISDSFSGNQAARNKISEDPAASLQSLLIEMADIYAQQIIQAGTLQMGDKEEPVTENIGTGDGTTSPVLTNAPDGISTAIITAMAGGEKQTVIVAPDGTCSGAATGKLNLDNGIWEVPLEWENPIDSDSDITITAALIPDSFQDVPYDIFFDGGSIKHRITGCTLNHSRNNPHNEITVESMSDWLYQNADETEKKTQARFEVHVPGQNGTTRFMQFLLEEKKSSDEFHFTLSGRSLSALEDKGFGNEITYSISEPTSAQAVAESILKFNALDWEIPDWVLPADFNFTGAPMDGLMKIAQAAGAIVRGGDDNTITICRRKKYRPIDLPGMPPEIFYDRSNVTGISSETIVGTGYTEVDVIGYSSDIDLPDLELETDPEPMIGGAAYLRVFWAGKKPTGEALEIFEIEPEEDSEEYEGIFVAGPSEPVSTFVTDGKIKDVGEYNIKLGYTDPTIPSFKKYVFTEGVVNVEKPITDLKSVKLIGKPGVDCPWYSEMDKNVEWIKYGKTIRLTNCQWAIAEIVYTSTYQRYLLYKHNVDILLAVFMIDRGDIFVSVKMNEGGNVAPAITDSLLTNTAIAGYRGTNYLDNNRYDVKKRMLSVPYHPDCLDGNIAFINNQFLECTGNHYINSVTTVFNGPQVKQNIEALQCVV